MENKHSSLDRCLLLHPLSMNVFIKGGYRQNDIKITIISIYFVDSERDFSSDEYN